jgi:hypothetical protein
MEQEILEKETAQLNAQNANRRQRYIHYFIIINFMLVEKSDINP